MMMRFKLNDIQDFASDVKAQKLALQITKSWRNFCKTVDLPEALVIDAEDISALSHVLKLLHERNRNLFSPEHRITARFAAGKPHGMYNDSYSITKLLESDVILRYVGKNEITIIDEEHHILEVSGFYQLGELNEILYEQYGLVIPTASLIPYVTVAGLAATAGHGTGRDQPSFSGLIVALTILKPDGECVTLKKGDPFFETIRSAHLGLFGVIISVQLQCIPKQKLECQIKPRSLRKTAKLVDKGLFTNNSYVELLYMPTYGNNSEFSDLKNKNKKNVRIRIMRPVSLDIADKNNHPLLDYFKLQLSVSLSNLINFGYWLSLRPDMTRLFMNYFATPGAIGTTDSIKIGPWYDGWHHLRAYPGNIINLDLLIPISADGHELQEIIKLIDQKLAEYAKKGLFPINLGICMRYFQGTVGALSTSSVKKHQHVLGLDFAAYKDTPSVEEFMAEIASILTDAPYYAKPHWGKNLPINVDYKRLYPEMDKYVSELKDWYQGCGSDLMHSALLNKACCDILHLPEEYYPSPLLDAASPKQDVDATAYSPRFFANPSNAVKTDHQQQQAINDADYNDIGGIQAPIMCNLF